MIERDHAAGRAGQLEVGHRRPREMISGAVVLGDGQIRGQAHVVRHRSVGGYRDDGAILCNPLVTGIVGVVGVGRMGLPVCAALARAGIRVVASDIVAEREPDVLAAGAGWDGDTARLASRAEVLITVLPGSSELGEAMSVALPALAPGATWIDLTSAAPATGRELLARAHARGIHCLDAPVGGGVEAARHGSLQLFVGGRADVVDRHRALLDALGRVEH
ncbi:MAG TPA: NAD(P)-binding domain-containing protein, partial [Solirubrobacteraceae bacterium]|nr:NAD(P)-binding domain-containing protein [Solirubrobacteraceae bacterium]